MVANLYSDLGEAGWKGFTVQRKLSRLRKKLSVWNKLKFEDLRQKLSKVNEELGKLDLTQDVRGLDQEEMKRKTALQSLLIKLKRQEESIWRQKSRINWLKGGDQNTKFFHRSTSWRASKNSISKLQHNIIWLEDPNDIKNAAKDFFQSHFKNQDVIVEDLEALQFKKISLADQKELEKEFSNEEIYITMMACEGSKAPGPDGFNVNFFKRHWEVVKEEIQGFINEFWLNGRLCKGLNQTYIVLIPKTKNPISLEEYRPISLVNSTYKFLAKCLAKRLSRVLSQVISPNQTAFLSNRNILDGFMIAKR
ncbi:hypothetical protein QQ045_023323 [Rhodiola kirilowii]